MPKNRKRSREVAFALAMAAVLGTSVTELGSTYAQFVNDFYQEDKV